MLACNKEKLRFGFTLIELLVVIAIIALLLGILLPSLQAVKKKVQAAICLSNQKQIGVAAGLYANDYKEMVPRGDNSGRSIWYQLMLPYIGRDQTDLDLRQVEVYRCGAFPKSGNGYNNVANSKQIVCYVINAWGFNGPEDMTGFETGIPTKVTKFRVPSSKLYIADNEAGTWRPVIEAIDPALIGSLNVRNDVFNRGHLPNSTNETDRNLGRRIPADRHSDGCNVLFLDFHAEKVKAEDVKIDIFRER